MHSHPTAPIRPPFPSPELLHEVFVRTAARLPEAVAVEVPPSAAAPRRQLTYREVDRLSDRLAARLAPWVAGECVIALLVPRSDPRLAAVQLAVLKAGAAYTCVDAGAPPERLRFILEDAGAVAAVVASAEAGRLAALGFPAARTLALDPLLLDDDEDGEPAALAPPARPAWLTPSSLAYVIYTSGTTGRPKGVMIEHRSIVNLVLGDAAYFGLGPGDRVGQSSSAAYDSSIEEIWLAFGSGATLVVLEDEVARLGPDLVPWLRAERIGVLCPPPTLLRMTGSADPARDLPDLKLLYVGGEELPPDVADRWGRGRWLENGYGPTECTVTVVRGRVRAGEPITIGRPIDGATAHVLDGELRPEPPGEIGELAIGGVCLARGYLHQPALTAERFVDHPELGRLYRTGDLVRQLPGGDYLFFGRVDAQVKIRGHRIELAGIEAILAALPGVRAAAVKAQEGPGGRELVAFLVADPAAPPPVLERVREAVAAELPEVMRPVRYAFLPELPVGATSGKLDRGALPDLLAEAAPGREIVAPQSDAERAVAHALSHHLQGGAPVSIDDDFFLDLGGTSLSAAQVISSLRQDPATAGLTVRDIYEARTVEALAARAARPAAGRGGAPSRPAEEPPDGERPRPAGRISRWAPLVGIAQLGWILLTLIGASAGAYWVTLRLFPRLADRLGETALLLLLPAVALLAQAVYAPLALAFVVGIKKLLIGRYRAGRHPYLGGFYLRNWIVRQAVRFLPWDLVEGTVFKNLFLRALGARIGRGAFIHRGVDLRTGGWDLLEVGAGATLGRDASVGLVEYERQEMVLGPVSLGAGATLDTRARMAGHSTLEAGAFLSSLSVLPAHATLAADTAGHGVPAAAAGPAPTVASPAERPWPAAVHGALLVLARMVTAELAFLPLLALAVLLELESRDRWAMTLYSPASFAALPLLEALTVVIVGLALAPPMLALIVRGLGAVRPGTYPLHGRTALIVALKEGLLEAAGNALSGTLFWPGWLRLAGMRVGKKCEISTIMEVIPELVEIGDESFFADGIYLGRPLLHRGTVTCARTVLGSNTFLGNHAVIPGGARLPDDILLGISTTADAARIRPGTSWFGHPAFELPRREVVAADRSLTHDPDALRYATRLFWEVLRGVLPVAPLLLGILWFKILPLLRAGEPRVLFFGLLLPGFALAEGASLVALVVVAKWLLLGRVRPGQHALWSCWSSRWDFHYVMWVAYARASLASFEGTPFLTSWLRFMGARLGRRVVLGIPFAHVVDPDMLEIGDDATVCCLLQAHSFEDRILKIAPVHIGARSTVGNGAVLLYGAQIGEDTRVEDGSVVMKHESLLPGQYYVGAPTHPARPPEAA